MNSTPRVPPRLVAVVVAAFFLAFGWCSTSGGAVGDTTRHSGRALVAEIPSSESTSIVENSVMDSDERSPSPSGLSTLGVVTREDMPPVAPMIPTGCHPPMEFLNSDPRFRIFRTAIEETGLDAVFGNVRLRATILLPTDDAIKRTFTQIQSDPNAHGPTPDHLLTDYVELERLVRNHVIPMYSIGYDDFLSWEGCYDTMVQGSCIQTRISTSDDAGGDGGGDGDAGDGGVHERVLLGNGPVDVAIDDTMRDMNTGCPTTMHAIDGLLIL